MTTFEPKFYTVEEAAKLLRVRPAKVRELIKSGHINARRVGTQWRIPIKRLEATFPELREG